MSGPSSPERRGAGTAGPDALQQPGAGGGWTFAHAWLQHAVEMTLEDRGPTVRGMGLSARSLFARKGQHP